MFQKLQLFMQRPCLYEGSTSKFWDDPHISQGMLEAHLAENVDAATRNLTFVRSSVQWISQIAPPSTHGSLLDLGCGPGIYAELFAERGYQVTGVDISPRSIKYASESAEEKGLCINYLLQDYLELQIDRKFDVITMIYYDYGVLSPEKRKCLLQRIRNILKPEGIFIFDVVTPHQYDQIEERRIWEYSSGGFYSADPYICLHTTYAYEDYRTFCNQHIVITNNEVNCYNTWEHTFTTTELEKELRESSFQVETFYGNIAGDCYEITSKELCVVAKRR